MKTNNLKAAILGTLILSSLYFLYKNSRNVDEYKKTFSGEAIGLTTRIKSGKAHVLRYYFYDSNKKILSGVSNGNYDLVNKFYKVKYDLNAPEKNMIFLKEELKPDSIALVKAGFTKTKYYEYDDVKAEYLGKWKWK